MITPAAIVAYRQLRSWDGKCTCPPPLPYGGNVFNSADPEHVKREQRRHRARRAYERACAKCKACPAQKEAEADVLRELRIKLKPWEMGLEDLPEIITALEQAMAANGGGKATEAMTPASPELDRPT